jgi:hypothetical protein
MIMGLLSKLRGGQENWPATVFILKPMKGQPGLEVTKGRRADENEDEDQIVSDHARFELKGGGRTEPIPYHEIYNTDMGPVIFLFTPERGTYLAAELGLDEDEDDPRALVKQALGNQEWMRWGKQRVMDMKLSWEPEEGWLKENAETLLLFISVIMLAGVTIMIYMMVGDHADLIKKYLEGSGAAGSIILGMIRARR